MGAVIRLPVKWHLVKNILELYGECWNSPGAFFLLAEEAALVGSDCVPAVLWRNLRSYSVYWGLSVSDTLHRQCATASVIAGARSRA